MITVHIEITANSKSVPGCLFAGCPFVQLAESVAYSIRIIAQNCTYMAIFDLLLRANRNIFSYSHLDLINFNCEIEILIFVQCLLWKASAWLYVSEMYVSINSRQHCTKSLHKCNEILSSTSIYCLSCK